MMSDIPWIEKYRPTKLCDVVSQEESISVLENTLTTGELPHLLLHGTSGTGKTTSILAMCRQLFGPRRLHERVIELNASDERGINIVRGKIINFAKIAIGTPDPKYLCPPYKIIILDEADAMTKEAQAALRKVMEENSNITRFCFICNYANQIIEPINSRCVKIRFKPIKEDAIIKKLEWIAQKEDIYINYQGLKAIAEISFGDLRKSILMLQNIKYISCDNLSISSTINISADDVYSMCKYISTSELNNYVFEIKTNDKITNIIRIAKDIINKGFIFNSIVNKIISYITNDNNIPDNIKAKILFDMSFIEANINDGADEYIQLLKILNNIANINQ